MENRQLVRRYIRFLIWFIVTGLGFAILYARSVHDRNTLFTVNLGPDNTASQKIGVTVSVPKMWEDVSASGEAIIGAQYDVIVKNDMENALIDWEIVIKLPMEARIDSSWNGEFINTGDTIKFIPGEDMDVFRVKPGVSESFGMILQSVQQLELCEFVITGCRDVVITDYSVFYLLLFLLIAGIITMAGHIIFDIRMRSLRMRQIYNEKIILETMHMIANFIDAKDEYTKGHSTRVADYAVKIAKSMGMSEEEVRNMGYIGLMHDCGKMGIADNILNKPGKLTDEERRIIQMHTVYGGKILNGITTIEGIREGALYHHERYDGKGYPEGLKGEEIPLCARIIGVADSFDAMNSDRCYRKKLPMDMIIKELKENVGKQFDPEVVKHMLKIIDNT